ncbi:hypothetical protein H4R99_001147 [Coemansia sp. RSA 1722]|nr:hypothetical protein LPJ57_000697 [Coemansia sp. RSA 486]KAJ2234950.1 hypothetical protein IWW45_003001 [Coemansia sp. RSA 485]KAJ2602694.1 hypothetical protein GGF39_000572 [Coemansia sp. RSA 1721]KAJ2605418.1 hypothetical protein H4R99_001147 [Coemansia sp. RSA 1722]KAJ2640255.1 hypothetical protein GGF40_000154 [Coemansia sp. RSA 1286]
MKDNLEATPILSWSNITYDVKSKQGARRVLHDISGEIYPGELVAIMGSSGAGKTTLLNVLSGRVQGGRLYGDIKFNGQKRVPHSFKRMLAYVEQDDLMFAQMTVRETLTTSAQLRLPDDKYTQEQKTERVDAVMRQLRLTHVADSKIGGYGERGVSGGERKRVSIGIELVTDPAILVLDEPSSGLDSSSAEMVVSLTKEMSVQRRLCTLMTIHQPSAEMVAKFDKVIILAQGKLVYMGGVTEAVSYFEGLGFPSTNANPASFFIDLTTVDFSNDETMHKSEVHIQALADAFTKHRETRLATNFGDSSGSFASEVKTTCSRQDMDITQEVAAMTLYEPAPMNSWTNEVVILIKREWALAARNKSLVYGMAAEPLVMMLFLGFVFFQLNNNQASVQNRIGALFSLTVSCTFPVIIPAMTVIMSARDVVLRERSGGAYRMSSYFFAKSLSFYPLVYLPYIVMFTGAYFIAHFQYDAAKFFIGLANMFAILFASMGFSFVVSMLVRSLEAAHIITPVALATLMLFAGNMSNSRAVTPVLRWIKYVCIYYYAYSGFVQNEFNGLDFECEPTAAICYHTGEDVVRTYGLDELPIWLCIVLNLALGVAFYAVAYCLLRWKAKPKYLWL